MSGAEILSMRLVVAAGLSGPGAAVAISTSCPHRPAASPGPVVGKASSHWYGGRVVVMRSPFYLPCPSTPLRGTVRAFSRQAGLRRPLLTSALRSDHLAMASVPTDTAQISWGKPRSFPRSPAGFTAMALDGSGLRDWLPARPTIPASDPIPVRRVAISLHASFRRSLAVPPLRFARTSPPSGCTGDFHPQAAGHAQHTAAHGVRPPPAALGLTRACLQAVLLHHRMQGDGSLHC